MHRHPSISPGQQSSSAELDPRRRRILFRCWRRGIREVDLLLGSFADARIATLRDAELDELEALMEAPDADLYAWLAGRTAAPDNWNLGVLREIKAFHAVRS